MEKVLEWGEFFMMSAKLASMRSKDPCTRVGAVIVNNQKRIIGSGYNGFCNGISDSELPWTKESDNELENKHIYVVHAELNAILNCSVFPKECIMYCTLMPCCECTKAIIQSGICKVVYMKKKTCHKNEAVEKMMKLAGVSLEEYPNNFVNNLLVYKN